MLAIEELGEEEQVGLLPDEEWPHLVRAVPPVGTHLLRPPRAVVSLLVRPLLRPSERRAVPLDAPGQKFGTTPGSEVGRMPPVHLEMELALPRVGDQPGLL